MCGVFFFIILVDLLTSSLALPSGFPRVRLLLDISQVFLDILPWILIILRGGILMFLVTSWCSRQQIHENENPT